ncbi:hypothetical protein TNCT_65181 [Trichonephila clavata]|uniref:Uncharacterized protein n=1 Tax=Trichonephila clavata TaxID=2740835 RepID=A0A8X6GTP9_TRICU|nr:hypothetical protein TNCT_65181 [Trichonephila clavata]
MKIAPPHPNQLAHSSQYARWRSGPNQPPMNHSQNQVYIEVYPQRPTSYQHHPSFTPQRPTMVPRSQRISQQRPAELRPDAPTFHPSHRLRENNTIIRPISKMRSYHPSEHQFKEK